LSMKMCLTGITKRNGPLAVIRAVFKTHNHAFLTHQRPSPDI
jgi:hypothetical protein